MEFLLVTNVFLKCNAKAERFSDVAHIVNYVVLGKNSAIDLHELRKYHKGKI